MTRARRAMVSRTANTCLMRVYVDSALHAHLGNNAALSTSTAMARITFADNIFRVRCKFLRPTMTSPNNFPWTQDTKFDNDAFQGLGIAVRSLIIYETAAADPLAPVRTVVSGHGLPASGGVHCNPQSAPLGSHGACVLDLADQPGRL